MDIHGRIRESLHSLKPVETTRQSEQGGCIIEKTAEVLGLDIDKLVLLHNNDMYYVEQGKYVTSWTSVVIDLDFKGLKEQLHTKLRMLENMYQEKRFKDLYLGMQTQEVRMILTDIMSNPEISDADKCEIWVTTYTNAEYGHVDMLRTIDLDMLRENRKHIKQGVPDGEVTIYRGMTSKSTPMEDAVSWTLSREIAEFFATRYISEEYKVVKAVINSKDIYTHIVEHNEKEVLVDTSKLQVVEEYSTKSTTNLLDELKTTGAIYGINHTYLYQDLRNLIDPHDYENPRGVHGTLHVKRVLLHTITLAYLTEQTAEDTILLGHMAVYHDIGRVHDGECEDHGRWSIEHLDGGNISKISHYGVLDEDSEKIFDFVVTHHCINDQESYKNLEESDIKDKERARRLYDLFCDADNLDRVRLGDLDKKYLRNNVARLQVRFAQDLLKYIK